MKSTTDSDKRMNINEYSKLVNNKNYVDTDLDTIDYNFESRDQIEKVFKIWNKEFLEITDSMEDLEKKRKHIMKVLRKINTGFASLGKKKADEDKPEEAEAEEKVLSNNKKETKAVNDNKFKKKNKPQLIDEEPEQINDVIQSDVEDKQELKDKKSDSKSKKKSKKKKEDELQLDTKEKKKCKKAKKDNLQLDSKEKKKSKKTKDKDSKLDKDKKKTKKKKVKKELVLESKKKKKTKTIAVKN